MVQFMTRDLVWVEIHCEKTELGNILQCDVLVLDAFKHWMVEANVIPVRNPVNGRTKWVGGFSVDDGVEVAKKLKAIGAKHVVL